jgi:hypothetical protein
MFCTISNAASWLPSLCFVGPAVRLLEAELRILQLDAKSGKHLQRSVWYENLSGEPSLPLLDFYSLFEFVSFSSLSISSDPEPFFGSFSFPHAEANDDTRISSSSTDRERQLSTFLNVVSL